MAGRPGFVHDDLQSPLTFLFFVILPPLVCKEPASRWGWVGYSHATPSRVAFASPAPKAAPLAGARDVADQRDRACRQHVAAMLCSALHCYVDTRFGR